MKSLFIILMMVICFNIANSMVLKQSEQDSLIFTIYMDIYYNKSVNKANDTINLVRFAGNSKFTDEFRLNIISLLFDYRMNDFQAAFDVQFGDMPHLLARADQEFVKYISRAYLGYTLPNNMKIQVGYLPDPIGIESGKPLDNMMTSISLIGYYEPDNFIGAKFITPINDYLTTTLYFGNPFTLKDGKNKNMNYGLQFSFDVTNYLNLVYSMQYGNQSEVGDTVAQNLMYNNFAMDFSINDRIRILAEVDYGIQKGIFGIADRSESYYGAFVALQYELMKSFFVKGRYEFFYDQSGFMTGNLLEHHGYMANPYWYGYGMNVDGMAFVLEYHPANNIYFKSEYHYMKAKKGQHIFNNNTSEEVNYLIFNTGIRF